MAVLFGGGFQESRFKNEYVLTRGELPPQPFVPSGMDEQDMFLFAGWAHGLDAGDTVSEFGLYLYIQSHVDCRSSETLEEYLAMSPYWEKLKSGRQQLTDEGVVQLARFGKKPEKLAIDSEYVFSRKCNESLYSVCVDTLGRKRLFMDNAPTTPSMILRKFQKENVELLGDESTWTAASVFKWVLYGRDYTWIRM